MKELKENDRNETDFSKDNLKKMETDLNQNINNFISRHFGSKENFEKEMEKKRINNLENKIIDYYQLNAFCFERIPEFKDFYEKYLIKNEPQMCVYEFFSNLLKPYLEKVYKENDQNNLRGVWNLIEDLLKQGDFSVKNEIQVVLFEEIETNKYFIYMSCWMRNYINTNS